MARSEQLPALTSLEEIFRISLWESPNSFVGLCRVIKGVGFNLFPDSPVFGVLVQNVFHPNVIKQVINFLSLSLQVQLLKWYVVNDSDLVLGVYGIYPTVNNPTIVFTLGTSAEEYTNENVLPALPGGWGGLLRRLLMTLGGFHPSLGGVIIVVGKR